LDGIGECGLPYGADFQGRLLALGSVYVAQFSGHVVADADSSPWSATVGGTFNQCGGNIYNGGVEAQNDLWVGDIDGNGQSATGSIHAVAAGCGGHVINLNAVAAGTIEGTVAVGGTKTVGSTTSLSVSLSDVADYFTGVSSSYCLSATTKSPILWGTTVYDIEVTLNAAPTIIEVSAADLLSASRLLIKTGPGTPAGAVLVINVPDAGELSYDDLIVTVDGATPTTGILLINFCNAEKINMQGVTYGSILAPKADVTFIGGTIWGNLIVGSLHAGGVNNGCEMDANGAVIAGESGQVNVIAGQSGQVNTLPFNPDCPPTTDSGTENETVPTKKTQKTQKKNAHHSQEKNKARKVTAQAAQANAFQAKQQQSDAQWMWAAGGAVAGIALSALVAAGVAFARRGRSGRRAVKRSNGSLSTPQTGVTQSPAAWSPQSTVSRRGSSRFPLSP
jgi:choice-of-anchor A domain-containing protein